MLLTIRVTKDSHGFDGHLGICEGHPDIPGMLAGGQNVTWRRHQGSTAPASFVSTAPSSFVPFHEYASSTLADLDSEKQDSTAASKVRELLKDPKAAALIENVVRGFSSQTPREILTMGDTATVSTMSFPDLSFPDLSTPVVVTETVGAETAPETIPDETADETTPIPDETNLAGTHFVETDIVVACRKRKAPKAPPAPPRKKGKGGATTTAAKEYPKGTCRNSGSCDHELINLSMYDVANFGGGYMQENWPAECILCLRSLVPVPKKLVNAKTHCVYTNKDIDKVHCCKNALNKEHPCVHSVCPECHRDGMEAMKTPGGKSPRKSRQRQ